MFGKEPAARADGGIRTGPEVTLSIISDGVKIVGDIESNGILKVDGTVEGSVRGARQILLGRAGTIRGDISTFEAVIAGEVHGSISASVRLELQSGAIVNGDVDTKSLVIIDGARINGTVRMSDSTQVAPSGHDKNRESRDLGSLRLAT